MLSLDSLDAKSDTAAAFCFAMAGRLQALRLSRCSPNFISHLPWLSNLRALVLDCAPSAGHIAPLRRLEYLHFDPLPSLGGQPSAGLVETLRWLSSEHSLRSLSVDNDHHGTAQWASLFRPAQPLRSADAFSAESALLPPGPPASSAGLPAVDWTKPCSLTDVSLSGWLPTSLLASICALPHLTRLQCESHLLCSGDAWLPATALANLQQLGLRWQSSISDTQVGWCHLQQYSQLRALQLSLD